MSFETKTHPTFSGYYPGVIGEITRAHAVYYNRNWSFDASFEIQVATELSEFIHRFEKNRDGLWVCRIKNRFAGAVALDGKLWQNQGARIRWFIVVQKFQGTGIGRKLLSEAMNFCRETQRIKSVFLWTFNGLVAARKLYESRGFRLCHEERIHQWGQTIDEQKFELIL